MAKKRTDIATAYASLQSDKIKAAIFEPSAVTKAMSLGSATDFTTTPMFKAMADVQNMTYPFSPALGESMRHIADYFTINGRDLTGVSQTLAGMQLRSPLWDANVFTPIGTHFSEALAQWSAAPTFTTDFSQSIRAMVNAFDHVSGVHEGAAKFLAEFQAPDVKWQTSKLLESVTALQPRLDELDEDDLVEFESEFLQDEQVLDQIQTVSRGLALYLKISNETARRAVVALVSIAWMYGLYTLMTNDSIGEDVRILIAAAGAGSAKWMAEILDKLLAPVSDDDK